jgi:iron complex transport system substrate-binding protein
MSVRGDKAPLPRRREASEPSSKSSTLRAVPIFRSLSPLGERGRVFVGLLLVSTGAVAAEPSALRLGPKLAAPPTRVVTLAPSLTETVLALNAGPTLVGVSRFDEAPFVARLPRVGGFSDPSVESVLALKPQLVIAQKAPGNRQAIEKIASLGISVLALPLTSTRDVLDAILEVGVALGRVDRARELTDSIVQARERVRAAALEQKAHPKVLLIYGFKPLVVAGPGSFADELLSDVGAVNVAEKAPSAYPVFSLERAVALQPDVVIDCSDVADGRAETQALINKPRWVQPKSRALLQPGPSLGRALTELQLAVYAR